MKTPISQLTPEVRALLVKQARLTDVQRTNHPDSDEWKAASAILAGIGAKLDAANAPHPDDIDWAA